LIEFYRSNPNALAQLRAPIYEEKVVDYHSRQGQCDRQAG